MGVQDKKSILRELLENGKAKGKLSTKEISDVLEELDYDVDQVDKLYDLFEQNNIDIVEDMVTPIDEDFKEMNRIYAAHFQAGRYPARTTAVTALPNPDFLLEIECVAALD